MNVVEATAGDAPRMSEILTDILLSWNSQRPRSAQHVLEHYIDHPDGIRCSVARDETGTIIGFQSLKFASANNPFDLPIGWGIIGTYVTSATGRQGVGRALFLSSLEAARAAGLKQIDATIGADNHAALAYYEAMGFETYRTLPGALGKRRIIN